MGIWAYLQPSGDLAGYAISDMVARDCSRGDKGLQTPLHRQSAADVQDAPPAEPRSIGRWGTGRRGTRDPWGGVMLSACLALGCGPDAAEPGSREASRNSGPNHGMAMSGAAAGTGAASTANPARTIIMQSSGAPISIDSSCSDPTVMFVIDGSGSMGEAFGGPSRWAALRSALLDPMTGFIARFQDKAAFGLIIYDGTIDTSTSQSRSANQAAPMCPTALSATRDMMCPRLISVPPRRENLMTIESMYADKELGGSTPTDKALAVAVDQMIELTEGKDPAQSPGFIILATDGEPNDLCFGGRGGDGSTQRACVVSAVDRAAAAQIRTYVISLAGNDMKLEQHLAEVAKHGDPSDPAAHTYNPMTPEELVMALKAVLTPALGCELQ